MAAVKKVYMDLRYTDDNGNTVAQQLSKQVKDDAEAKALFDAVAERIVTDHDARVHFPNVHPHLVKQPETKAAEANDPAAPAKAGK